MEHISDTGRRPAPDQRMIYRKNKYAAPIGGLFLLIAAIGLISVGALCVRFTMGLLDNSHEKQKFEQIILPVLMFDPPAFENPGDLDPLFLLQSAFWNTALNGDKSNFDDLARLVVPASDVDVWCARLYGPDVKLQHQSFSTFEDVIVYDDSTKTYHAPVTGQVGLYTPGVQTIVKRGDAYELLVGYIPPTNAFTQIAADASGGKPEPVKFMVYELLENKGYYQLTAIREAPKEADPNAPEVEIVETDSPSAQASSAPGTPVP